LCLYVCSLTLIISTKYTELLTEIMSSFDVCLFVCLCAVDQSTRPVDNVIEMPNTTDSKFGSHVSRDSPNMTPKNFFEKGAWLGSCDPLSFWLLNANSSKMVKAMDFTFGVHVLREMTLKCFSKRGHGRGHVTPKIHLAEIFIMPAVS